MDKLEAGACLYGQCYTDETMANPVSCEVCLTTDCILHEECSE